MTTYQVFYVKQDSCDIVWLAEYTDRQEAFDFQESLALSWPSDIDILCSQESDTDAFICRTLTGGITFPKNFFDVQRKIFEYLGLEPA